MSSSNTHTIFHPLEVSPPSKLTLGSEFASLPTVLDYSRVVPFIIPEDAMSITHVNQLVRPLSQQQCTAIYKSLEFDHFLVRTLIDKSRGVHVQEYLPSILPKVILLLTMYQHHRSYELGQHVETIIGLAAEADVIHLENLVEAHPYASVSLMRPSPNGIKCPVCWDSFEVPSPKRGDDDDDDDDDDDIDMDDPEDEVLMAETRCGHNICLECLELWIKESATCPVCRRAL